MRSSATNGVDGVHFYRHGGGIFLQNFRWTNVGEDAYTVKSSGTVNISGVSGFNGEDKFSQNQRRIDREHLELHRRQHRGEVRSSERRHHLQDHGQRGSLPDLEHEGKAFSVLTARAALRS